MRKFFLASLIALLVGVPAAGAAAHDGWFVRVCPAKTEANRVHLIFSGGRQGFSWSWTKGRTPNEIDLPRRFHSVARLTMRGSTVGGWPARRKHRSGHHRPLTADEIISAAISSAKSA